MKRLQTALFCVMLTLLLSNYSARAQTALINPAASDQPSASIEDGWSKYTHPIWGITIAYPSVWTLNVPDFDKLAQLPTDGVPEGYTYNPNVGQISLLGHHVALVIPNEKGLSISEVTIALDTFTLSPGTDLREWLDLRNQLNATENPLASETTITQADAADLPFANAGDQVAYEIIENKLLHHEAIWIAKGELVFLVMTNSTDPVVQEQFFQVASSLEFNNAILKDIRASAPFTGDERQIKDSIDQVSPQPAPSCDIVCRDQRAMEESLSIPTAPITSSKQAAPLAMRPSMTQKALPPNWFSPITGVYAFSYNVLCGSPLHNGNAEFAVDVSVGTGTPVYALSSR